MIRKVETKIDAMDLYRAAILGLMGIFYAFLLFLMLL